MTKQALDTAFELLIAEGYAGEIECESKHPGFDCSGEVTHISKSHNGPKRVCLNSAKYVKAGIAKPGAICDCLQPTHTCWSIRPI